jgi:hypothetical protein
MVHSFYRKGSSQANADDVQLKYEGTDPAGIEQAEFMQVRLVRTESTPLCAAPKRLTNLRVSSLRFALRNDLDGLKKLRCRFQKQTAF